MFQSLCNIINCIEFSVIFIPSPDFIYVFRLIYFYKLRYLFIYYIVICDYTFKQRIIRVPYIAQIGSRCMIKAVKFCPVNTKFFYVFKLFFKKCYLI